MKNIDFIVKSVSKELDYPEEDIKDLLRIYWKEVIDNISPFEKEAIYLRNLGTFQISYWLLRQQVTHAIKDYRYTNNPARKEKIIKYLTKVLKMREQTSQTNNIFNSARKNNKE